MYEAKFVECPDEGHCLILESVSIKFETKEEAHDFLIKYLKETGRLSY